MNRKQEKLELMKSTAAVTVNNKFCFNQKCNFYGNDRFDGYCSGCWKEMEKSKTLKQQPKQQQQPQQPEIPRDHTKRTKSGRSVCSRRSINEIVKIDLNSAGKFQTKTPINYETTDRRKIIKSRSDQPLSIASKQNLEEETFFEVVVGGGLKSGESTESKSLTDLDARKNCPDNVYDKGQENSRNDNVNERFGSSRTKKKRNNRKASKIRCSLCPRSIMVIGFDCRCGKRFCIDHRLAKDHSCSFDYRAQGIVDLAKENPKIVGDKIQKL